MNYRIVRESWVRTGAISLIGFVAGIAFAAIHSPAAPLSLENQTNTTKEPIVKTAKYNRTPNALSALVLSTDPSNTDQGKPIVILIGLIDAEVIMPGQSKTVNADVLAYSYLDQADLKELPSAKALFDRSIKSAIDGHHLDVINTINGVNQLRRVFAEAQGIQYSDLQLGDD